MPEHHDGCDHGASADFADLVDELVTVYLVRTETGVHGALVTVHAELTDDVFTLQVGTGRDAAAFMQAARQATDAMRGL